jgi:hypothetical protein
VLVLAVVVALALLAVAVSWGHVPADAQSPAATDEPSVPDQRAA